MDSIYIETSIVSHATAWPSADPMIALLQQQARDWWDNERSKFRVVTSQLVLDEAALGDPTAAAERLRMLAGIDLIPTDPRIEAIADELIARHLMPEKARLDAFHVATAAVGGGRRRTIPAHAKLPTHCQRPYPAASLKDVGRTWLF